MGIPAGVLPFAAVGELDVGFDDAAMLLEPEPHVPDNPDVSGMPDVVDTPDVAEIAVDVDIPDDVDAPGVAAVAGMVVAVVMPPPS
jgi:hypothetical protein